MLHNRFRLALPAFLLAGCSADAPTGTSAGRLPSAHESAQGAAVTVMTRNVYLGANLDTVIASPSVAEIPVRVAIVWATVQASNPPERMRAIADEIARTGAQVVGLQEVSLWRTQVPGDAFRGNPHAAVDVVYDFLALLIDALRARGLEYRVASVVENFDAELFSATGIDVRMTDRDAVIVRSDVHVEEEQRGHYAARFPLQLGGPGGPMLPIPRGWNSLRLIVGGERFRLFNTHLEVDPPPFAAVQVAQARELVQLLSGETLPTLLIGDFNSNPDGSETPTYAIIRDAGYGDAWEDVFPSVPGLTCCHRSDLRNEEPLLRKRIDIVFFRGAVDPFSGDVVGDEPGDRTPSGLWPSDHAGAVAGVQLLTSLLVP